MTRRGKALRAAQALVLVLCGVVWKWPGLDVYLWPVTLAALAVALVTGVRAQLALSVGFLLFLCGQYLRGLWHVGVVASGLSVIGVAVAIVAALNDVVVVIAKKPPRLGRRLVVIGAGAVGLVGLLVWAVPRSPVLFDTAELLAPGVIPASVYADNLYSGDQDLVRESLGLLAERADPVAVSRAIPLLESPDDYVWLNAALYLGACGRPEAVPYLIKALRHQARRSYTESARDLHSITGEDFGTSFERWQTWWTGRHPGEPFDWSSHLGRGK